MPIDAAVVKALANGSSDGEIARDVAAGDKIAFEVLMRKHNRMLYRVARAILRDDAEAEDAFSLPTCMHTRALRDSGDNPSCRPG